MKRAFSLFAPRLVIILETELWPAFLISAKRHSVPVFLFNGRMSDKSAGTYARFHRFFGVYGPEKIWAISELDQNRFAKVMGKLKVETMHNMKFDRITPVHDAPVNPAIQALIPEDKPFILLGSIRKEEEDKVVRTIQTIISSRPDVTIGLFPKHITRADIWQDVLKQQNITSIKRSEISQAPSSEHVIIWDVFGELASAYNLATTTFVGGSLVKLGGQNFLEPLVFGLRPVIGPYWRNFAWVGREIIETNLVTEVENEETLSTVLLERLDQDVDRTTVLNQVSQYFEPKKGGTEFVCRILLNKLHDIDNA
jgi:3-deoxy-D-manno-octulosonic-acid transferase